MRGRSLREAAAAACSKHIKTNAWQPNNHNCFTLVSAHGAAVRPLLGSSELTSAHTSHTAAIALPDLYNTNTMQSSDHCCPVLT